MKKALVYTQKPQDFHPGVEVAACYLEINGKLLLLLRSEGKREAGRWGVPGGKIETGETPLEAAVRELREETGISIDPSQAQSHGCLYIRKPGADYTYHLFRILLQAEPIVRINGEHRAYRWAAAHEIELLPLMAGGKEVYRHYCSAMPGAKKRAFSSVSSYLILKRGDAVLLGLRRNTGYCDGLWSLPAGHIEDGEPATVGMAREAYEEIGVLLDPSKLTPVHVIHRQSNRINIDIFFTCSDWEGEIENKEPDKCETLQFFPLSALPENCVGYNREVLQSIPSGRFYSELGWES